MKRKIKKIIFFMQPTPDFVGIYSEGGKRSAKKKVSEGSPADDERSSEKPMGKRKKAKA